MDKMVFDIHPNNQDNHLSEGKGKKDLQSDGAVK